jgi:hypothetical protein
LWTDDNGTVREQQVEANGSAVLYDLAMGVHHIVIRATDGSAATTWDIFTNTSGNTTSGTCELSVAQSTAPLSAL